MARQEIRSRAPVEVSVCDFCGHGSPWHSLICKYMKDLHCRDCTALLPRHYPNCPTGVEFGFLGWQLERGAQYAAESLFQQRMRERAAQRVGGE